GERRSPSAARNSPVATINGTCRPWRTRWTAPASGETRGAPAVTRRVVHYVDSDVFGGSEEVALHLMASLDRTRWEPVLLHHTGSGVARLADGAGRLGVRTNAVSRGERGWRITGLPP